MMNGLEIGIGFGVWFWALMLLIAGLAIAGLVAVVARDDHGPRPDDPDTILDRHLAQGDVSPDDYEQARRFLKSQGMGDHR